VVKLAHPCVFRATLGKVDCVMLDVFHYLRKLACVENSRDLSDWELVERFVTNRDEAAFAVLVDRHGPMVFAICRRITPNDQDAEDALQATFLVFVRKASTLQSTGSLRSWFHGVAVRLARKVRDKALQQARLKKKLAEQCGSPSIDRMTLGEVQSILDEELAGLAEHYRSVILLCCLEGKSREEAALELGWKLGTVKIRLERGREALRRRLLRRGLTLSSAMLSTFLAPQAAFASIPVRLVASVVNAGVAFAANRSVAGMVSGAAVGLAEGVLRSMALAKVKLLAVLLCVGFCTLVTSALAWHWTTSPAGDPTAPPARTSPNPPMPARADEPGPSWKQQFALEGHKGPLWAIAFAPDQQTVATGGEDRSVLLWDLQQRKLIKSLGSTQRTVRALRFSPDQSRLFSFEDRMVRTWDVTSHQHVREHHVDLLGTVATGSEGEAVFAGKSSGRVGLFSLDRMTPIALVPAVDGEVVCAVSGHRERLAFGRLQGTIRLWELAPKKEIAILAGHQDAITALAFSPDGRVLASASQDRRVKLWDAVAGKEVATLAGHNDAVLALAFAPDGRTLATGSADRTVKVWDVATGKEQATLPLSAGVQCVAFSPDGKTLAVGGADQRLTVWVLQEQVR